jgi:hypothetical protein
MTTVPPLSAGLPFRQILDEAVRQSRRHFRRIYPPIAIPMALMAGAVPLTQALLLRDAIPSSASPRAPNLAAMMGGMVFFAFVVIAFGILWALSYCAMFVAATDALAGRPVSMRRAFRTVLRPRLLGTQLLVAMAVLGGMLLCVLPGLYVGLLLAFTVPVMVEESRFGPSALRRSSELARYNPRRQFDSDPRLHVFVTGMVGAMLGYTISFLVQLPFIALQQFMVLRDVAGGQRPDPAQMMARLTWLQVPTNMLGTLTNTAVNLYVCFGIALLFFDLRRRKEGLDLEEAVAALVARHRARRPS